MKAQTERTEVILGQDRIITAVLELMSRARTRLDICASSISPGGNASNDDFVRALVSLKERGVKVRLVTEIVKQEIEIARLAVQMMEVRHLPGLRANFVVSDTEYMSSPVVETQGVSLPSIYSNSEGLIEQHQSIFDRLWEAGEPAGERIKKLESGQELLDFEVIRETGRTKSMYLSLVTGARKKILLLLPTPNAFFRDDRIGLIDKVLDAARRGVKVRLAAPFQPQMISRLSSVAAKIRPGTIEFRSIPPAETSESVTMLVVDDRVSLTIDERDPSEIDFEKGIGMATLISRQARLRTNVRFFERSWLESELREAERNARQREESSRRRAELMQDILTHDIRNFNQVARLNAELLADVVSDRDSKRRISAIIRSIDGSTSLIERTKKLGNILEANNVELHPVSLKRAFERSVALVKKANPGKKIEVEARLKGEVLADALIDEVFINLVSNSVRYTGEDTVRIKVSLESESRSAGGSVAKFWKISISDWGRGIPEPVKPNVFGRYLETAKGSGLGMSIVHALITERYGGRVAVRNRVEGDYRKGTTVDIWLPRG